MVCLSKPSHFIEDIYSDRMLTRKALAIRIALQRGNRWFASETEKPFQTPPSAPPRKKAVWTRNVLLVTGWAMLAYIFLKPWDNDSILGPHPNRPFQKGQEVVAVGPVETTNNDKQ